MPQPSDPQSIHNSYLGEAALFEPNDFTPERPRLALTDEEKAEEPFPPKLAVWPMHLNGILAACVLAFLYSYFSMRDHMVEKVGDELRWGGEEKQSHALTVIKRWLFLENLGIGTSLRMLHTGLIEDILDAYASTEDREKREAIARIICLSSARPACQKAYLESGAIDELRKYVSIQSYDTICAIANLSSTCAVQISEDKVLMKQLVHIMAQSFRRASDEDRFIQGTLYRLFGNLIKHPLCVENIQHVSKQIDNLTVSTHNVPDFLNWVYRSRLLVTVRAPNNPLNIFGGAVDQSAIEGLTEYPVSSLFASVTVAGLAACFTLSMKHMGFQYKKFKPYTLYQEAWWSKQLILAPLFAVIIFNLNKMLVLQSFNISEKIQKPSKSQTWVPSFEDEDTTASAFAILPQAIRIPVYLLVWKYVSPFAILPAMLPWKLESYSSSYYFSLLPELRFLAETLNLYEPPKEATDEEIEIILEGKEMEMLENLFSAPPQQQ